MCRLSLLLVITGLSALLPLEGTAAEFVGSLSSDPVPAYHAVGVFLRAAKGDEVLRLPEPLPPAGRVFRGKLGQLFQDASVALVMGVGQPVFLYIDRNRNSILEAAERTEFRSSEERPELEGVVLIQLGTKCGPYDEMPVELRLLRPRENESQDRRVLAYSAGWRVRGQVPIDGREVLVEYPYSCDTGTVNTTNGLLGIDSDGSGDIDWHPNSPENAVARDEAVVFRVGSHYVSTARSELENRRVVLRTHAAADYRRIELTVGSQIPDFSYADFQGQEHRLSDVGAQYILLDFWFAACGPCIAEIPNMKAALEKYRARGFEVLSLTLDDKEDIENARQVVVKRQMDWPQAAGPNVRDLINQRFQIRAYPNYVLLDRRRRIISTGREGESPLRGKPLLETLQKLLP